MIVRSLRTGIVAATLGIAAMGITTGAAIAKPMVPKGPGNIAMPGKFPKPHGPYGKWGYGGGWGPGIGIGLGVAALGIAAAHAYDDDCYVRRVVNVYGEEFYRKVCN